MPKTRKVNFYIYEAVCSTPADCAAEKEFSYQFTARNKKLAHEFAFHALAYDMAWGYHPKGSSIKEIKRIGKWRDSKPKVLSYHR